jgi:CDP-diacylglycerol--glycerol-3-phosphate 3-phosphatidyltransferase
LAKESANSQPKSSLLWEQLPNVLTLARVISVPVIVWLLLWDWSFSNQMAGFVFFAAGLSDVLDGIFARRHGTGSQVGIFFDLIGDKLLVAAILFTMVELGWMPGWLAASFVAREFAVMGLRAYAGAQGVTIGAGQLGKAKMMWQYIAFNALMWERSALPWFLVGIALLLTLSSGIHYGVKIWRGLRARPAPNVPDVI